jgi:hypothetical protein
MRDVAEGERPFDLNQINHYVNRVQLKQADTRIYKSPEMITCSFNPTVNPTVAHAPALQRRDGKE